MRYGYRKIRVLLNREGWIVGKKPVYRLYREERLTLRHKARRRRRTPLHRLERFRPTDFVADQLADGRRFRALTVMDVSTREFRINDLAFVAGLPMSPGPEKADMGSCQSRWRPADRQSGDDSVLVASIAR